MKAVLDLELIGDDVPFGRIRPWVARLSWASDRLCREFLRADQKDYARANSIGSRGVYAYYILSSGVYEVQCLLSWRSVKRYFIRVEGDVISEITREEAYQCLNVVI